MPEAALIVVDMLNAYDHEDADALKRSVREVLPTMADLVDRAKSRDDVDLVYVNDVYGHWNAGRAELVARVLESPARDLVEPIVPPEDATFIVKARHSICYQTPVEYMLRQEGVSKVILVGQVTEQCILYSALDAYIRHIDVAVPRDAVAHIQEDLAEAALRMMQTNMRADIVSASGCLR
jgi:nicotinamidase-related amidase